MDDQSQAGQLADSIKTNQRDFVGMTSLSTILASATGVLIGCDLTKPALSAGLLTAMFAMSADLASTRIDRDYLEGGEILREVQKRSGGHETRMKKTKIAVVFGLFLGFSTGTFGNWVWSDISKSRSMPIATQPAATIPAR